MASSDPKGAVSASTQNSPGAPAESPVKRRTVRETRRVSDRVHARQTTAAHAAQGGSRRDPPGTTPSRGPERVRRGARPAPLPRQGPAAGTMSPVLGRPPRAPRSHPVKPGATAPGVGEGTTATGKPTGAPRATGPDEEWRTNAGPRGTPERHAAGHNHGTRTGAKPQRPPGAANPGSAHNTRRAAARDKVPRTAGPPRPHTAPTASGKRAPAARRKGRVVGGGRAPDPGRPTPRQEAPPPGALVPPPQRAKPARKSARCGVGEPKTAKRVRYMTPRIGASGAERSSARAPGLDRPGENPVPRTGASEATERIRQKDAPDWSIRGGVVHGPSPRTGSSGGEPGATDRSIRGNGKKTLSRRPGLEHPGRNEARH